MIYQLPCGKVIYISTEDYFALTDEELSALAGVSTGEDFCPGMSYGDHTPVDSEPVSDELDLTIDQDEVVITTTINIHFLPDDFILPEY